MAKPLTSHRPLLAVSLKLSALVLFTLMQALVKVLSADFPTGEMVFFRSLFAVPIIIGWLLYRRELSQGLVVKKPMGHFWRGVLGTSAMFLTFTGLSLLPLPEVTAIGYATPIFTLILAALMLGERIRMIRIGAVAIGLLGVLIMIWPRLGGNNLDTAATIGALCVLAATIARGFVQIHIRQLVQVDHPAAVVFYFSITATLLSAVSAFWGWIMPTWEQALILVAMGLLGGVAQILVTSSYRYAQASMLAPYDYTTMLFAIVIGYIWFDELPTLVMLGGAALVIAGNVLVILRERQLGLDRGKDKSVTDPKA
ncbi:DMT family transporter [Ruegeria meonggei]|uniref:EamA-like transporter family protein n=1 Tax=Ruegeria meonggei TaxID=1446476 RepID=A0A1X6Z9Z2_9RHOB|nr:DMT family transporter [Ruegeria meonggei]SLN44784.1 EamA-like transporter family protein [Ruegeria meonggei]